ncbi:acyl carrier protein [Clostridium sp. DJ247]|uniref:acyl carrier protein n=1 Tax=Clostridium sp. DJ247 TaxID=2726188 RepID=UPI0016283041|nr:acyl carrier protein [Clostridium sp. DJ247]MBC2581440.1 acyl carrier protein [Clostridium sp. DJ247]
MNILEQVISIAKENFNDEELNPTVKIEDVNGFDSMALVQFTIELETNFNVEINDEEISRSLTFQELSDILEKKVNDSL